MIVAANAAVGKAWAHHATGILCGVLAGGLFLTGAIDYATGGGGAANHNPAAVDIAIMVIAAAAAAVASKPVRDFAARFMPIDPDNPVHALALALAVILVGTQVASLALTDVLAADQKAPPLTIADLVANEVPLLALGVAGVGLFMRRNLTEAAARLGFVKPEWWHIALALAAAGIFFGMALGADWLSNALTPSLAHQLNQSTGHVFGGLGDPVGIVALALLPGICEDALFRGALQPRFGLVVTAVLFAATHTEYGLTFDLPAVFLFAIGLGLIRRYTSTTASATCHVAYNLLVSVSITGVAMYAGIGVEVLLAAAVVYVIWTRRRRPVAIEEGAAQGSGVS